MIIDTEKKYEFYDEASGDAFPINIEVKFKGKKSNFTYLAEDFELREVKEPVILWRTIYQCKESGYLSIGDEYKTERDAGAEYSFVSTHNKIHTFSYEEKKK